MCNMLRQIFDKNCLFLIGLGFLSTEKITIEGEGSALPNVACAISQVKVFNSFCDSLSFRLIDLNDTDAEG